MAQNLFDDVVKPSIAVGSRRPYTLPLSILVHAVIIAVAIIVPLAGGGVLPVVASGAVEFVRLADPVVLPPPSPSRSSAPQPSTQPPTVETTATPLEAPPSIGAERAVEPRGDTLGLVESHSGVPGADSFVADAVPPERPPEPPPSRPIPVGGRIQRPEIQRRVAPVYPAVARAARVQGIVIVEATIGVSGKVEDARVLRSISLLDQAALDAVRQWEFTPTMLNGRAVSVVMTVTVDFRLQ